MNSLLDLTQKNELTKVWGGKKNYKEFISLFEEEKWFKVVALDPITRKFHRRDFVFETTDQKVTVDPIPFEPSGACRPGGIYFASLQYCHFFCNGDYGEWVAPVSFVPEHNGIPTQFYIEYQKVKANQIVLGQPIPMSQFCLEYAGENKQLFCVAARYGYTDVVRMLLANTSIDPSMDRQEAIRLASIARHTDVVQSLLTHPLVDPSAEHQEAFSEACGLGHTEIVRLLLKDQRVDPSKYQQRALCWAARGGHIEVVQLLLNDPRIDPSANNFLAIHYARKHMVHVEMVQMLLEHGEPTIRFTSIPPLGIRFSTTPNLSYH
jgi:hypothetical protein